MLSPVPPCWSERRLLPLCRELAQETEQARRRFAKLSFPAFTLGDEIRGETEFFGQLDLREAALRSDSAKLWTSHGRWTIAL